MPWKRQGGLGLELIFVTLALVSLSAALKKKFWSAPFGYLYYLPFQSFNEPGLGAGIDLAWLRHHFHLVLDEIQTHNLQWPNHQTRLTLGLCFSALQDSISSTFYARVFCTKDCSKPICNQKKMLSYKKDAPKTLMKLPNRFQNNCLRL